MQQKSVVGFDPRDTPYLVTLLQYVPIGTCNTAKIQKDFNLLKTTKKKNRIHTWS